MEIYEIKINGIIVYTNEENIHCNANDTIENEDLNYEKDCNIC